MQLFEIEDILFNGKSLAFTDEDRKRMTDSFHYLKEFSKDKIIYGITTGFGPMAQYRVNDEDIRALQYNIIRSHSCGAGEPFPELYVKAAMLARFHTFVRGKSGVGIVNLHFAKKLLDYALIASVIINEIAGSYDDFMAKELNDLKNHEGQSVVARKMLEVAAGNQCMRKRTVEMFHHHEEKVFTHKVQPYYSLRCVPQILGPIYDAFKFTEKILIEEFNAVDDNPVVDMETEMVYHGGNFHGDYVSFEMDKLKIATTKIAVLMERQLNYLCHDRINGILPPMLNLGTLGLTYGIQAMQFTACSTTAECQALSNSMYVHSIPNNNDNQDVVSMGTNSAILAKRVIDNCYQVMAIHYIALAQAVDCLEIQDKLSPLTRVIYDEVRAIVPKFVDDTPKDADIRNVENYLRFKV